MDKNMDNDGQYRFESYISPRNDRFQYYYFSEQDNPSGTLLAQQIQAQSYINRGFVRPEGLIEIEDGAEILHPDITNPVQVTPHEQDDSHTEYIIGIEKGTTDLNPLTGSLVTWRKRYAPLDELPTYNYCKDNLLEDAEEFLRWVEHNPELQLVEPEGLGKTEQAGPGAIKEFMRNEIQRVQGRGEVWFMGLVEKTVFQSFVHNWGPVAVVQVGNSKQLVHPHIHEDVTLVPTVMDIDHFFEGFYQHIQSLGDDVPTYLIKNFVYMVNGVSDKALGPAIAAFRAWAEKAVDMDGGNV